MLLRIKNVYCVSDGGRINDSVWIFFYLETANFGFFSRQFLFQLIDSVTVLADFRAVAFGLKMLGFIFGNLL